MSSCWCRLLIETMWVTGPQIFSRPIQVYSYDRVLRSIKRKQAQCRSTHDVSAPTMFSNTPLVKVSHMVKPTFKGQRNRSHILMGIAAKSHCKRCACSQGIFAKSLPSPYCQSRQQPCKDSLLHLAGSITGLVGLHVSRFSCGKMKWFGENKEKDVKCLKLPEGIVSITFPYLYKNKITHICILICMYIHTQIMYIYTYILCSFGSYAC